MKWLKEANEALFGWGSPVAIGVFRILIGFLSFVNLILLLPVFNSFFTEPGLYPAWMAERWTQGSPRLNLLAGVTDPTVTTVLFALVGVASILTMLGLFTRVASIMLFVGVVTIHHRSPDVLHSGDTLLRQWLFILMLAPAGASLSLDRLIRVRKGLEGAVPPRVSLWPQRLIQIQLAIVYFTTVWHKWFGDTWRDGTASYYAFHLHEFDRFPVPAFVQQPWFVMAATYGTLIIELALATLVFAKPLRKWVLLSGIFLHAYIEYSMNIPMFEWVIVAGFVSHYSGEEVSAWAHKLADRFPGLRARFFPIPDPTPDPKQPSSDRSGITPEAAHVP